MMPLIATPKDRVAAENQSFVTLGQILGGGFILTGLYFTAKSYTLTRRGQFAERLAEAIEGLGASDNLQRRVGSIYGLGALTAGADTRDKRAVEELLCAFVRSETLQKDYKAEYERKPRPDVQAALSVLSRISRRSSIFSWSSIDLRQSHLSGADLSRGDWRRARLEECEFSGCTFFRSRLAAASLQGAKASNCDFNQTDLRGASLFRADSAGSTFRRAWLRKANLTRATLTDCSFDGAWLIDCTFGQAELTGATFSGSHIRGGSFYKVPPEMLARMGL
jgi:hypothetical protein